MQQQLQGFREREKKTIKKLVIIALAIEIMLAIGVSVLAHFYHEILTASNVVWIAMSVFLLVGVLDLLAWRVLYRSLDKLHTNLEKTALCLVLLGAGGFSVKGISFFFPSAILYLVFPAFVLSCMIFLKLNRQLLAEELAHFF